VRRGTFLAWQGGIGAEKEGEKGTNRRILRPSQHCTGLK
jgi:hypothetical protein